MPADLVERYYELVDREDGCVASERLADRDAGRATAVSADEVARARSSGERAGAYAVEYEPER